jgi:hypothetical protein
MKWLKVYKEVCMAHFHYYSKCFCTAIFSNTMPCEWKFFLCIDIKKKIKSIATKE